MGQEISIARFKHFDFHRYESLLRQEMEVLSRWFAEGRFSKQRSIGGLELEAWLVDATGHPTPWNERVISLTGLPEIVPELSRFNLEFNVAPQPLQGTGLAKLVTELEEVWQRCNSIANRLGTSVVSIGILPTICDADLSLANLSNQQRYRALNEQVLRMRQGRPLRLNITGRESLVGEHRDVMLESAATSFQLHLQVPLQESVRYYNASLIASAALVAIAGNSPILFNSLLWEETRIPLFEQSVDVGEGTLPRVTFGTGYVRESLLELFQENIGSYPVMLPLAMENSCNNLSHVRLLNGTIWRWNRPLIGFDEDGTPHLRIEQRVMAAGPTVRDMAANMALFHGLVESLAQSPVPPEQRLPFVAARDNFYRAARLGLECEVDWLDGQRHHLRQLISTELLPLAAAGLQRLQVAPELVETSISLLEERVQTGQTGAVWQRRYFESHGRDAHELTCAYRELQHRGEPVHTWPLELKPSPTYIRIKPSMLHILNELPDGLLTARATDLLEILKGPTLIHLPGRRPETLFVSVLLHGNEDVGLKAVQACLRKHPIDSLPRSISIFIGNVDAARQNVRRLPEQPDFNRVWPGGDSDGTPEHQLMRHVVAEMRQRPLFASIDLHNNTGWNPHYACVTHLDHAHLQLASLFGRTAVFFQRPRGVQTMAFAELCPSVTCECGKVGDEAGIQHAADFVEACLNLAEIPRTPLAEGDLHLFHTVATVTIPPRVHFSIGKPQDETEQKELDLILRGDLERLNFQELEVGTELGTILNRSFLPLTVTDQSGRDVTSEYLTVQSEKLELRQTAIPAMLTSHPEVIRQDCLGYFMERYEHPR